MNEKSTAGRGPMGRGPPIRVNPPGSGPPPFRCPGIFRAERRSAVHPGCHKGQLYRIGGGFQRKRGPALPPARSSDRVDCKRRSPPAARSVLHTWRTAWREHAPEWSGSVGHHHAGAGGHVTRWRVGALVVGCRGHILGDQLEGIVADDAGHRRDVLAPAGIEAGAGGEVGEPGVSEK
jgi:hypothetical protein